MFSFTRLYLATILFLIWSATAVRARSTNQGGALTSLATAWGVRFNDWELSTDPCSGNWTGVTCDTNGRVVKLLGTILSERSKSKDGSVRHSPSIPGKESLVDAFPFPGNIVFFLRVLNLLRGK